MAMATLFFFIKNKKTDEVKKKINYCNECNKLFMNNKHCCKCKCQDNDNKYFIEKFNSIQHEKNQNKSIKSNDDFILLERLNQYDEIKFKNNSDALMQYITESQTKKTGTELDIKYKYIANEYINNKNIKYPLYCFLYDKTKHLIKFTNYGNGEINVYTDDKIYYYKYDVCGNKNSICEKCNIYYCPECCFHCCECKKIFKKQIRIIQCSNQKKIDLCIFIVAFCITYVLFSQNFTKCIVTALVCYFIFDIIKKYIFSIDDDNDYNEYNEFDYTHTLCNNPEIIYYENPVIIKKEDIAEDNKEDIAEDNKKDIAKDNKEDIAKDKKENIVKDNKENIAKDNKEDIAKDNKEDIAKDNKENIAKDNKEDIAKDNKDIV
jgi:hypothetical protein